MVQMTVALTIVGIVLAVIASTTDWPGWLILVLFVVAALVARFAWPDDHTDD